MPPEQAPELRPPVPTPSLDELVKLALERFQTYTFVDEGDGPEAYPPLYASWETVEEVLKTGVDPFELGVKLARESTLKPDDIDRFPDLSMRGAENWQEVFFALSDVIVYGELLSRHPEVSEEYQRRIEIADGN